MICTLSKIRIATFLTGRCEADGFGTGLLPFIIKLIPQTEQVPGLSKTLSSSPHPQGGQTYSSLTAAPATSAGVHANAPMQTIATIRNSVARCFCTRNLCLFVE